MKKFIIIGVIVVALFIIIYFIDDIIYFIKLLKMEFKHKKKVNELMTKNIKRRWYKNSVLKKYIIYIDGIFKEKHYNLKKKYRLNPYLMQRLKYSKFDDKILYELLEDIFKYIGLDCSQIKFNVRRTSSRTKTMVAGSYNQLNKEIILEVTTYSNIDKIVSTLAHESTHHFLLENGIKLNDRNQNEILTDITAIYLGFGDYFYRAYRDEGRIIFDGEYREVIDRNKLGYIGYGDVKYVQRYSRHMRFKI